MDTHERVVLATRARGVVNRHSNDVLPAKAKIRVAERLGSRALRADAAEPLTCGYLSAIVVVGLLADLAFRAWWVDGVTSLAIVYFLVKEVHRRREPGLLDVLRDVAVLLFAVCR